MTFIRLCRDVRAEIGQEKRYRHTVRVARLADRLAQRHGVSPEQARLAAMLHDLARLYAKDDLVKECERRGMAIDPFERKRPVVLHARLGAELARERFGVDDQEVLSAIRAHTLAAPEMSPLDEIVYLADSLEPGRHFPERALFEGLSFLSLANGMRAVLGSNIAHLRAHGEEVAPQTQAAYNRYASVDA